jgi:hypothetical protein
MDNIIDARFERLEKALLNLIDSVTKYHPSTVQAEELSAADIELSKGLEQVQAHQNNHLRIQDLRKSSAALDAQIRETLTTLAATRKDIVTTQTTTYPKDPSYSVAYEELLRYARRISKTTLPPTAVLQATAPIPDTQASQTPIADNSASAAPTPSAVTPSQTNSPAVLNGGAQSSFEQLPTQQSTTSVNTVLPEPITQWLNPLSGQLFFPWPLEDKIRSGALASNQMLVEQGIEPKGYDPVEVEERKRKEEEERKEKEEKEKLEREERERKLREERERVRQERERQREKQQEEWRRASVAAGAPGAPGLSRSGTGLGEKKQFQFTSLDDLDDDDDD